MSDSSQSSGKLDWQELLSAKEIAQWATSREQPRKLWRVGGVSRPGVYRFIFPKGSLCESSSRNRSSFDGPYCYLGVACHFGDRLRDHICPNNSQESEDVAKNVSGRRVCDAIKKSIGKCYLEYLAIEGTINFCDIEIKQNSFNDLFARLLLENWAIFHSEQFDKYCPLNRGIRTGIQQDLKDDLRPAEGNIVVRRHGMVIKRGGLESLL